MYNNDRKARLQIVIISPDIPITQAISTLDRAGIGILLLCDEECKLLGTITDGDVRRALLNGVSFEESCIKIATKNPVIARSNPSRFEMLHLMDRSRKFVVNHLPVLDETGRVMDLILRRDLILKNELELSAVIMAGGFGTRLSPLTKEIPKPMLPVGGRPLMQFIVEQLCEIGIKRINISTHYKPEKIMDYFGDGNAFGVNINYLNEEIPLGTAGAIGLITDCNEPLLVINGDILTRVDYRAMLLYHKNEDAELTVASHRYHMQVPYGVIECEGPQIIQIREKPDINFMVNAGIYLLEPSVHRYIKNGLHLDMTELIGRLIADGRNVVSFPIIEYWLDIGQYADYEQAQKDIEKWNCKI